MPKKVAFLTVADLIRDRGDVIFPVIERCTLEWVKKATVSEIHESLFEFDSGDFSMEKAA